MSHCYTFAPACVRLFSAASIKDGNTIKKSAKPKRSVPLWSFSTTDHRACPLAQSASSIDKPLKNTLPLRDKLGYIYCDLSRRLVATIISLVKSGSAIGVALIWDIKLLMMRHTFSLIVIYTQPSVLNSSQHLTSHHRAKILRITNNLMLHRNLNHKKTI